MPAGRQAVEVAIELDRLVELIDAEAMLGQARDRRTEQAAAGGEHQSIVCQLLRLPVGAPRSPSTGPACRWSSTVPWT
jgi:hypothetical protein